MRTFKFRAWDNEFEMMFYSNSSDDPLNVTGERIHHLCGCEKPEGHLNYFFFEKAPIMQFTGLHDKNGKEIYEGDILLVRELHDGDDNAWRQPCGPAIPCQVTWDEQFKQFDFGGCSRVIFQPYHFEVIGNVYENPDLLKGE